ncbi:MAG TPA: ISNCY family transposase, partial [Arsenophonus nasoniae]
PMEFITEIAKQSEKHEGALMTIAQQIEEIGIKKGIQQGKIEGIQEGMKKAKMELAIEMLNNGMDKESIKKLTKLSDEELNSLRFHNL